MITLSVKEWMIVRDSIQAEHGPSMILIRDKMRRELGFTVREHSWTEDIGSPAVYQKPHCEICLDFYSDAAETMFRLRWL